MSTVAASEPPKSRPLRRALPRTAVTLVCVVASFASEYALCRWCGATAQPAILAAILAIVLSRRSQRASLGSVFAMPAVIAGTALAASGVGRLLHLLPPVGAVVFTAGMFVSIWLRNFGERGRSVGALIAMPLVAMLVVPARAAAPGGALVDFALIVSAGIIAFAFVAVAAPLARRLGITSEEAATEPPAARRPAGGLAIPTRMALQMAAALGAAFVAGFTLFAGHWAWAVLTAFIVCSGARGRGDAAYKGVLRLAGAFAGTLAAGLLAFVWAPGGVAEAVILFVLLFFALWLRETNYAYWAGFVTLILAFLTRSKDGLDLGLLGGRLEAILAGALCAVAAAWFVYPIRTEAVIRRRLADALAALDELVAHAAQPDREQAQRHMRFARRMAELAEVAPPVVWHRRLVRFADRPEHPGHWIELTEGIVDRAWVFVAGAGGRDRQCGLVRRAIGISRRAIGNHGKPEAPPDAPPISVALQNLRLALDTHAPRESPQPEPGQRASHVSG